MPNCLEGDLGDCGDWGEGGKLGGCSKLPLGRRRVGNIITDTNTNMPLDLFCPSHFYLFSFYYFHSSSSLTSSQVWWCLFQLSWAIDWSACHCARGDNFSKHNHLDILIIMLWTYCKNFLVPIRIEAKTAALISIMNMLSRIAKKLFTCFA